MRSSTIKRLFAGELPPCLITLHRHPKARGYHWAEKYEHAIGKRTVGEVALNNDHFKGRTVTETFGRRSDRLAPTPSRNDG
jgi:N-formylglutamate amidohydrolase